MKKVEKVIFGGIFVIIFLILFVLIILVFFIWMVLVLFKINNEVFIILI